MNELVGPDPSGTVKANRLALAVLPAIAAIVGFAPAVLMLGRPQWLAGFAVLAVVASSLTVRGFTSTSTERPSSLEFLLGGLGTAFLPAVLSTMWLLAYILVYAAVRIVNALAVAMGRVLQLNASAIALYPSAAVALVLGVTAVANEAETLANHLYPETAGIKSSFYRFAARPSSTLAGRAVLAIGILAAAVALLSTRGITDPWLYVFLQVYLLAVSFSFMVTDEEDTRTAKDAVRAIRLVFEDLGYTVQVSPRTHRPDTDPLLTDVDLLAQRGDRSIVVDVKTAASTTQPVDWTSAAALASASEALRQLQDPAPVLMDLVLVLVDAVPDESLENFIKERLWTSMSVVSVTSEDIGRMLDEDTGRESRLQVAERLVPEGERAEGRGVLRPSVEEGGC